ncbi:hypothetical protein Droror1_Dr00027424 [Drosera rotundifolia]
MSHDKSPHVAMLPSPGLGHLISLVQVAKLLVTRHGFTVTIIIPSMGKPTKAQNLFVEGLPEGIDHILLPPVFFHDLPESMPVEPKICMTITRSFDAIHEALTTLKARTRLVAFMVDLFGCDGFDIAIKLGIPHYLFFPSTPMALSLLYVLPTLDETTTVEYRDLPEPVKLPGCAPLPGKDFLKPVQDRKGPAYKLVLHHSKRMKQPVGTLLNACTGLDPEAIKGLQDTPGGPPIYPIGPFIHTGSDSGPDDEKILKWLDDQPAKSVLYIAFGSGGTLTSRQLNELALGLEKSDHRFLWVVKSPNDKSASSAYFSASSKDDPLAFLPDGFLQRTEVKGLVVPSWAPQVKILEHTSTGAFLTHCGWGSILEGTFNALPLIAWPLYAEQPMNAVMVSDGWRVAVRPKANEEGLVPSDEVAEVVREVMEGEEGKKIRERMKALSEAAKSGLADANGSSSKSLAQLAEKLKSHANGSL